MDTHESNEAIGNAIALANEGDRLIVSTEEEENIDLTVEESEDMPDEVGREAEVICRPTEGGDDVVVDLYARLTKLEDMYAEYDAYAVRQILGEELTTENLGEITEVQTES